MSGTSNTYDDVARNLESGAFELFTCDVFDTLVWRPVASPTDLFVELGYRLRGDGVIAGVDPLELSGARQRAEHQARIRTRTQLSSPECRLEEIWDAFPAAVRGSVPIDRLIAAELACESNALRVHRRTAELLSLAHRLGITTTLVSDTYLSGDQLSELLRGAGVDLSVVDHVITSSDRRRGKADGLLADVIAEAGARPERTLHFGDNVVSDLGAAAAAGAVGVLAEIAPERRALERPAPALRNYADVHGTDAGLTGAMRETLLDAGADGESAAFQFGVAIAGPAIAGFCDWASITAERLGAGTIHCLLREGAVFADLMRILRPGGPSPVEVHASRWALVRAAVFEGTEDEVLASVERRAQFRAEHLADAFDLALDEVVAVVGSDPVHHHKRSEAIAAIAADDGLREQIVNRSAQLRRAAQRYYEAALRFDDGPLVVCDIGWGGKIQACLEAILADAGMPSHVTGLYLMLSETGVRRRRAGARMLSYLPETTGSADINPAADVLQHHAAILERVATPQLGTLLDFTERGQPVCRPADHESHQPSLVRARAGVYAITNKLASNGAFEQSDWLDRDFRAALLDTIADAITTPTAALAADLADWEHDDLGGDDAEALVGGEVEALARYLNVADARLIDWDQIFWLPGLAAGTNPSLSAQLAAVRRGIDREALAPVAETGVARFASFPAGSAMASHQTEGVPHRNAEGWQLLRLHDDVPSLRSLRLDAGESACIVQNGLLRIVLTVAGEQRDLSITSFEDRRLHWIDGHPLSASLAVFDDGGHLLIEIDALGDVDPNAVSRVDADWAFRTWPLSNGDRQLTRPPLAKRGRSLTRRLVQRLRKRP